MLKQQYMSLLQKPSFVSILRFFLIRYIPLWYTCFTFDKSMTKSRLLWGPIPNANSSKAPFFNGILIHSLPSFLSIEYSYPVQHRQDVLFLIVKFTCLTVCCKYCFERNISILLNVESEPLDITNGSSFSGTLLYRSQGETTAHWGCFVHPVLYTAIRRKGKTSFIIN